MAPPPDELETLRRHGLLTAVELCPHPAYLGTATGATYANRRWREAVGWGPAAALDNPESAVHPEDLEPWRAAWRAEGAARAELRLRQADGGYRWHLGVAEPMPGGEEAIARVATFTDIHERRRAEERLGWLQAATSSFSAARTLAEVRQVLLGEVLEALGANGGGLRLVTPQGLVLEEHVLGTHADAETARRFGLVPLDAPHPSAEAARTGRPVFHRDRREVLRRYPHLAGELARVSLEGNAHLPLRRGEEVFGVLSLSFAEPCAWDEGERAFALALADRAATAYERARLYEEEGRARRRAEALYAVTAALAAAADPLEVVRTAVARATEALGALRGSLYLARPGQGELEHAAAYGPEFAAREPWRRIPVGAAVPLAEAFRTGEARFFGSLAEVERGHPELVPALRGSGFAAAALLPLRAHGEVLGVLSLVFAEPQAFAPGERGFLQALAAQAAQALERARLFEELRRSEGRFRALVSQASAGIGCAGLDGRLTFANAELCAVLGLEAAQAAGHLFWSSIHPDDLPESRRLYEGMLREGLPFAHEVRLLRPDGSEVWVKASVSPLFGPGGAVESSVAVVVDISERKRSEQELERRVAERTRDLEAFARSVAHDLRSPLRQMEGFAQALLEDYAPRLDANGVLYLRSIAGAAARLDALTQDLLAYAHLTQQDLALGPVDLEAAVRHALAQLHRQARLEGPFPAVRAHPSALGQVLSNLLDNAFKFVPPGRPPDVSVRARAHGEWVRVCVEDNGIGVDQAQHGRIFEPFQRLHGRGEYPGTGIGLALVKRAVEKMGGRVGVESEPGQGSTFWFELPRA